MKKQVGVIVDSTNVSKKLDDLISLSKQSNNYEITALIINSIEHKKKNIFSQIYSYILRRGLSKFVNNALFRIICKLESYVVMRLREFHNFYGKVQLNAEEFSTIYVKPNISKNGLVYHYVEEDIKRIEEKIDKLR